ncbi:M64 family metallopeptidase [Prevotella sp. Rep29]|uniref:M64 family metallopeptidase n=1 Tax=Prevotella sp. Rep29 TaxID=2691580 RepID=UPI001C6DDDC0|nr:M64 family metallopeptidase [Prevotella sp. Rep29]MBQ3624471.1 hypothetical protein [Prevotella sp.]QYR10013.1 hypothetical protein GRF55_02280 [Prevotella sp. Rep29]
MKNNVLRQIWKLLLLLIVVAACNEKDDGLDTGVIEGIDLRAEYDGKIVEIQKATKGEGINIVMLGDGYTVQSIIDGSYDEAMRKAASYLFLSQPMKALQEYFNVYYITAVSMNSALDGQSAMGCMVYDNGVNGTPSGSIMTQKAKQYVMKLPDYDPMNTLASIVINSHEYGGVTYYPWHAGETSDYNQLISYAYTALHADGIDGQKFKNVIQHETVGHAFAKLADEYAYNDDAHASVSASYRRLVSSFYWPKYWYYNIAGYATRNADLPWEAFIDDPDYATEDLGFYEGAHYYRAGYYRATSNSIMRDTEGDVTFNAPSRYAIYLRTMLIGEGRIPTVEEFKTFDKAHRD